MRAPSGLVRSQYARPPARFPRPSALGRAQGLAGLRPTIPLSGQPERLRAIRNAEDVETRKPPAPVRVLRVSKFRPGRSTHSCLGRLVLLLVRSRPHGSPKYDGKRRLASTGLLRWALPAGKTTALFVPLESAASPSPCFLIYTTATELGLVQLVLSCAAQIIALSARSPILSCQRHVRSERGTECSSRRRYFLSIHTLRAMNIGGVSSPRFATTKVSRIGMSAATTGPRSSSMNAT